MSKMTGEQAIRFQHNLERLSSLIKEYNTSIGLLNQANQRLKSAQENYGDTKIWSDWIEKNAKQPEEKLQNAAEALEQLQQILCGSKKKTVSKKTKKA